MIAREGYPVIVTAWVLVSFATLIVMSTPLPVSVRAGIGIGLALVFGGLPLYFFRDPPRAVPLGAHVLLLAPADGRVVNIALEDEPQYLQGPARRISIFLSILNVHVNRIPADGVLEFDHYVRGSHHLALREKASRQNEQSQLGIRHPLGHRILFKQVAGGLSRRIVYHVTCGDTVKAGDRFGMIRFGSRLDVLVSPEVPVTVRIGDRVRAGATVLGSLSAT